MSLYIAITCLLQARATFGTDFSSFFDGGTDSEKSQVQSFPCHILLNKRNLNMDKVLPNLNTK